MSPNWKDPKTIIGNYATLILAGETGDNLLLRIPPEVLPTVEQIVAEVREKQAFYAQPPGE